VRDMSFLPLGILLLVDIALITATTMEKLANRYKRNHHKGKVNKKAFLAKGAGRFARPRQSDYQEINEEYHGFMDSDLHMESHITFNRAPTGFEQLGALEADFAFHDLTQDDGGQKTNLHLFVESLSKCLGATKFGLTFEFQDLNFTPPKSKKKILSDVSGTIHAGSLWGVMGASGAGKCKTFPNLDLVPS
jgi:ABC-type glutathione transport system ATPase component